MLSRLVMNSGTGSIAAKLHGIWHEQWQQPETKNYRRCIQRDDTILGLTAQSRIDRTYWNCGSALDGTEFTVDSGRLP
jgi:hypothetical protein